MSEEIRKKIDGYIIKKKLRHWDLAEPFMEGAEFGYRLGYKEAKKKYEEKLKKD